MWSMWIYFSLDMPLFKKVFYSWMLAVQIDTKDILFICGGAFVELEKTIAER